MSRPNIVFIQNDHQAFYNHKPGSGAKPLCPNFDQLALSGVRFDNAYCITPLCGPARRTMLTGEYVHEHKQYFNYKNTPFAQTYLEVFADAGYKNYYFGKWHAGPTDAFKQYAEGFTCEGYGNPYITETYRDYCERYGISKALHWVDWAFDMDQYQEAQYWPALKSKTLYSCAGTWCGEHAVGETVTEKDSHEAFFLANLACEKLREIKARGGDEPFTLRVDFWGPHQPYFPTREFIDMYENIEIAPFGSLYSDLEGKPDMFRIEWTIPFGKDNRLCQPTAIDPESWAFILKRVYAHITMVDAAGGRIIDELHRLGLDENTLIVWTTDHGDSIASNGGHFDKGSHMCEEVMRIPFAASWKGVLPAGQVRNEWISTVDFPVTLLDAAGLSFAQHRYGKSLLTLFREPASDPSLESALKPTSEHAPDPAPQSTPQPAQEPAPAWRDTLMCEHFGHGHGEEHISKMIRCQDYKLVYHHEPDQINELYNLNEDGFELRNLYYDERFEDIRQMMMERLREALRQTEDELADQPLFA